MSLQFDNTTNQLQVVDSVASNVSLTVQSRGTGAINFGGGSSGLNLSNGTTVTAITRTAIGGSYTSAPAMALTAPTTAGGVQATATCVLIPTNNPSIVSGGTGYTVGDVLTFVGGTGTALQMTVTAVSAGVITAANNTNTAAYTVAPTNPISVTGGTGSGATFSVASWCVGAITITNAGSGYVEQPTVTFSGGGGSGAAAYATVGSSTIVRSIGATSTQAIDFQSPNSITSGIPLFRLREIASADSFVQIQNGLSTSGFPLITSNGNANANLSLYANGSGTLSLGTNGTSQTNQLRVTHTASAVNFVQVTGAATTATPVVSAQGSDANVALRVASKGTQLISFSTNYAGSGTGNQQFTVTHTANSVNNLNVTGAAAGTAPVLSSVGADTNIPVVVQPKGTGAINLASGSSGVNISNGGTVTAITRTAGGSGYTTPITWTASAPTTAGGVTATGTANATQSGTSPTITFGGTGYSVNDVLTISGGTASQVGTITVTSVSGGVITGANYTTFGVYSSIPANPVSVTGGTGTGATFTISWGVTASGIAITNAGSGYVEQPTVTFSGGGGSGAAAYATVGANTLVRSIGANMSFFTPGGQQLALTDSSNSTQWLAIAGSSTSNISLNAAGASGASISYVANGGANHRFWSSGSTEQLRVSHTASAVNYVQVTGGVTAAGIAGSPTISAQGSDANIALNLHAKGTGAVRVSSHRSNFLVLAGTGSGGGSASISSDGGDTNIDLALTPKGTGRVQFGTLTASSDVPITGYIEIKDAGGTIRRLAVVA